MCSSPGFSFTATSLRYEKIYLVQYYARETWRHMKEYLYRTKKILIIIGQLISPLTE
jgi:hypothetical protein